MEEPEAEEPELGMEEPGAEEPEPAEELEPAADVEEPEPEDEFNEPVPPDTDDWLEDAFEEPAFEDEPAADAGPEPMAGSEQTPGEPLGETASEAPAETAIETPGEGPGESAGEPPTETPDESEGTSFVDDWKTKQARMLDYLESLADELPPEKSESFYSSDMPYRIERLKNSFLGRQGLHRDVPWPSERQKTPLTRDRIGKTFERLEELSSFVPRPKLAEELRNRLKRIREQL